MIKRLMKHGTSRALVIDKTLLQAAGLDEKALFQITVNPNGGLLIQSVDHADYKKFEDIYEELNTELFDLMQSLSKK